MKSYYNISLEMDENSKQKIVEFSKSLVSKAETEYFLDGVNFYPHISVYGIEIEELEMEKALDKIGELIKEKKRFVMPVSKVRKGKRGYLVSILENREPAQEIQNIILPFFNKLRVNHTPERFIKRYEESNPKMLEYAKEYGYGEIFEFFDPHVTYIRYADESIAQKIADGVTIDLKEFTVEKLIIAKMDETGATMVKEYLLK